MWCFQVASTLLFVLSLGEGTPGGKTPSTSKSVGGDLAISMPTDPQYVANNSKLEVKCVIRGFAKGPPPIQFIDDTNNRELKSEARLKITTVLNHVTNETTGTLTWDPIYVRDNNVKRVRCRNKDSSNSKSFSIEVIPSASIPVVAITNSSDGKIKIRSGGTYQLVCTVTGKTGHTVKDFGAKWIFGDISSTDGETQKPPNTETIVKFVKKEDNKTVVVESILTITDATAINSGKLYCASQMKFRSFVTVRNYYDEVNMQVFADYDLQSGTKEIKKKKGEDARLDCLAMGTPIPTLTWWKKDEYNKEEVVMPDVMDPRYSYEKSPDRDVESAANSVLVIKDVNYGDRSQYVCRVQFVNRNVTVTFTLRVADPLGPLWPVVGIIAETIILIVVIWYTEACTGKKREATTKAQRDEKPTKMSELDNEDAPLVSTNQDGALANDVPA